MATRTTPPARESGGLDYPPPRGNVLLLSCMDARLIDELDAMMSRDNLDNCYDHVVLAGASLGALQETYPGWRCTFFDHLKLAIRLHNVKDIYIVEHRNCGAYREFLEKDYKDTDEEQLQELQDHRDHAIRLRDDILAWCAEQTTPLSLNVRCFLMDLRGDVTILSPPEPPKSPRPKRKK
jgi:hypothetical protein